MLSRRAILLAALASSSQHRLRPALAYDDPLSHWTYGFVPPPVERTIAYEDLSQLFSEGAISSIQPSVQHDCVTAYTKQGHRLTALVPDSEWNALVADSLTSPSYVNVLPRNRALDRLRTSFLLTSSICAPYAAFQAITSAIATYEDDGSLLGEANKKETKEEEDEEEETKL